jgi:hypothetical protein
MFIFLLVPLCSAVCQEMHGETKSASEAGGGKKYNHYMMLDVIIHAVFFQVKQLCQAGFFFEHGSVKKSLDKTCCLQYLLYNRLRVLVRFSQPVSHKRDEEVITLF